MSSENRRAHERIPVLLTVRFAREERHYRMRAENVSLGGVFLRGADQVCAADDSLEFVITIPLAAGGDERHALRGTVVQVVPGRGIGVRFDWHQSMTTAHAALSRFVERAAVRTQGSTTAGDAVFQDAEVDDDVF